MFDSIAIGTSGLLNHAKGLRVVGNNLANVNTPGFKSSQLQFANLFDQGGTHGSQSAQSGDLSSTGAGLASLGSQVNFRAGIEQGTGNPLDLLINGNGFFVIKREEQLLYTRSGDFRFDDNGILVNATGDHVMSQDSAGNLVDITLDKLQTNPPKATSAIKFSGTIPGSSTTTDSTLADIAVIDPSGVTRKLGVTFHPNGDNSYLVTVKDEAGAALGTGTVSFLASGDVVAGTDSVTVNYKPANTAAFDVKLDFSANVKMGGTGLQLNFTQDGYASGVKTDQTIDADGYIVAQYSNGQKAKGQRVVLADFVTDSGLHEAGGSAFSADKGKSVLYGYSGQDTFGKLTPGRREGSNVDLAEEFGNLILMQRGYQASSHVISTANDMIQQLFDMKGNR